MPPTVDELPGRSEVMAQAGRENFTVASALLGRDRQSQLRAIYGFARLVDDVGDEVSGDRSALLDLVEEELARVYGAGSPRHPVMVELAVAVRAASLPREPFQRLIAANRLDQRTTRYDTFEQLLGYCQLSAAPVGELVLHVFDAATPARISLSDRICAGLQITEHLQDIAEDFRRGRVYVPREDLLRFGCDNEDLSASPTARRQALIAFEARRAHQLLSSGAPLARTLPWRPRLAVAGFVAGGRSALASLPAVQSSAGHVTRRRAFPGAFMRAVMGR
jgi:squalene synthase HpnC